jgi:hypothetical protein
LSELRAEPKEKANRTNDGTYEFSENISYLDRVMGAAIKFLAGPRGSEYRNMNLVTFALSDRLTRAEAYASKALEQTVAA